MGIAYVCDKCDQTVRLAYVFTVKTVGEPMIGGASITLDGLHSLGTSNRGRREVMLCRQCATPFVFATKKALQLDEKPEGTEDA